MKTDFLSPVGRLVQGDPFEAQTKNMQGQPLMTMAGQPTQRYFIAVAFRKDDPAFPAFYQKLVDVARASFPQLFNAQGQCSHPRFSWKLMDGDGVDENGKPNSAKEGFAGHWVVKFQSSFAPKCFHVGHYQPHEQIQDPKAIQRGYFVRVVGTIEGNDNVQKPGLYVNLGGVELVGHGQVITSGPDYGAAFGAVAPAALPPGAQPLPMHAGQPGGVPQPLGAMPGQMMAAAAPGLPPLGNPGMAPGLPMGSPVSAAPGLPPLNAGVPGASPAMMSPTNMAPAPMQQVAVAPNPAFLAGPGGVPGAMPAPAQPAGPRLLTITAEQYTAYRQQGYDDNALRAHGMIA